MRYRELIPKEGWIRKYVCYAAGSDSLKLPEKYRNEIPFEFHLFTGLTILGANLGRNVYVPRGTYKVYPAMITVLTSPTGICKKTTAISIGQRILRETGQTKIISESITPEALVEALRRERPKLLKKGDKQKIVPEVLDSTAIIIAPELSTFIDKRDYHAGLIPLITRLADCPDIWSSETIGRGTTTLRNVGLSALWASAPSWLFGMPDVMFSGGFVARCIYVCRDFPTGPVSTPTPLCSELRDELVKELIELHKVKGEMPPTEEAGEWFDNWYDNEFYPYKSHEEKRAAYQERKPDHLFRMALVISTSKCRQQIHLEDLKEALAILEATEEKMFQLFGTIERSSSTTGWILETVLKKIKRRGRIMHTDLMRGLVARGIHKGDIMQAIGSLTEAGFVRREVEQRNRGRSPIFYKYIGGEDVDDLAQPKKRRKERR